MNNDSTVLTDALVSENRGIPRRAGQTLFVAIRYVGVCFTVAIALTKAEIDHVDNLVRAVLAALLPNEEVV